MKQRFFLVCMFFAGLTGAYAQGLPLPPPYLAKANLTAAMTAATNDASDAVLVSIASFPSDTVQTNGTCNLWVYSFYSHAKDSMLEVGFYDIAGNIQPYIISSAANGTSYTPLPGTWINSDTAIGIAQTNGGSAFISQWAAIQTVISATLEYGIYASKPTATVWFVTYTWYSEPGVVGAVYYVVIDATTGQVYLSGTSPVVESGLTLPAVNQLNQNYPNPFTSSTAISFSLANSQNVSLRVYNTLGEEVADLADGAMSTGAHTLNFDAANVPEGVYYYRLAANGAVQTKQMTIVK